MIHDMLIVDDEELEREALGMFLEKSTLPIGKIHEARNGKEAVSAILNNPGIELMILDLNMPGLSGLDALELIRESGSDVKVIISTAYNQFEHAVKALQLGAVDFLVKPVGEATLLYSVEKALKRIEKEQSELGRTRKIDEVVDFIKEGVDRMVENSEKTQNRPDAVNDVLRYIENNYSEHIGLDDIVNATGYSKFHLNRIFKNTMGSTIIDYLIHYRMEKAKERLKYSLDSIKKISSDVGYSDQNYFSWTFSRLEGMSPMQYRSSETGRL